MTPSGAAGRYAALTSIRQGDRYVLGSAHSSDFVAVPEIGGQVVQWLQAGASVEECTRRATELAGEPVDVLGFLDGLAQAGLLPADDDVDALPGSEPVATWKRRLGRAMFGPMGLTVQALLAATAVVATITAPQVRPVFTDALVSRVPLVSILLVAVVATTLGLAHECAHVLGAWAAGVTSRVSISRRTIALVFQTDLTRLWSVPRRARVVPLLAGILFDGATIGLVDVLELTVLRHAPPLLVNVSRGVILLNVGAIVFQFLIFMRTDVYALFVVATGCMHLWDAKGAVARRAIGRTTAADTTLLSSIARREVFWAKVFLCLYVPGVLWTTWYFVTYSLPALRRLLATSLHAVITNGLTSVTGVAGATAFAITSASTLYVLRGLTQTLWRLGHRTLTRQ